MLSKWTTILLYTPIYKYISICDSIHTYIYIIKRLISLKGRFVHLNFLYYIAETDFDLLEAAVSLIDDKHLYISDGYDGFPSFGFRPNSEVKQPYRMYLPEKLPAEFTLVATFKSLAVRNSYLFAVLNPFETVVQLGIRISVSISSVQRLINYYSFYFILFYFFFFFAGRSSFESKYIFGLYQFWYALLFWWSCQIYRAEICQKVVKNCHTNHTNGGCFVSQLSRNWSTKGH